MTLEGRRQLEARLTAVGNTKDTARRLGLLTVAGAKKTVRRATGNTSRTIRMTQYDENGATVRVGGAGPWLEYGTRPHIIRPRNAKALRFPAKGVATTLGGRVRTPTLKRLGSAAYTFARIVRHPGTRAYPFMMPAARAAVEKLGIGHIIERWNGAA